MKKGGGLRVRKKGEGQGWKEGGSVKSRRKGGGLRVEEKGEG